MFKMFFFSLVLFSCQFPEKEIAEHGCTNIEAINYNPESVYDDGSCFELVPVEAGNYTYGETNQILSIDYDYMIMKFEVTNRQYVYYLKDALISGDIELIINGSVSSIQGNYEGDEHFVEGYYEYLNLDNQYCRIKWDGESFVTIDNYDNHPVIEVTWFGAKAFAEYYGMRLPTEMEWEKAARGNTGFWWPWSGGNFPDLHNANYFRSDDPFETGGWAQWPQTSPVGFYNGQGITNFETHDSHSPYGVYDMAGNVFEWTDSRYSMDGLMRVQRGGSWASDPWELITFIRHPVLPESTNENSGFRCVLYF